MVRFQGSRRRLNRLQKDDFQVKGSVVTREASSATWFCQREPIGTLISIEGMDNSERTGCLLVVLADAMIG